ncbi:MAG: hypothetical protein K0U68_04945 [Gammaproteobacteria bacterium]|nr:hypothetical protein [Gammaproteobacteria bacterium]
MKRLFCLLRYTFLLFFSMTCLADESLPHRSADELLVNPPISGEGFTTDFMGETITVPAIDRRSINAWVVGAALNIPAPSSRKIEPLAALYFWRRPNDEKIFYGDVSLLYNSLFFAKNFEGSDNFEWVVTFENFTVPLAQNEIIDGRDDEDQELIWGYIRPGFGFGYRKNVAPFHEDNMFAADFTIEPGYLFFGDSNTGAGFRDPQDTIELRTKLQIRMDAMTRNILSLPSSGFIAGSDVLYGHRFNWDNWGINGNNSGSDGRNYASFTAYSAVAGSLPFLSKRHRLIGRLNGGFGHQVDRFNHTPTTRLYGGINPVAEEYHTGYIPNVPGAAMLEFYPKRYAIAYGEYRYATTFFSFAHFYGGAAYMNAKRQQSVGIRRSETIMPFVGARFTTGFLGDTRLVFDAAHNFGLKRKNNGHGGTQVVVSVSGEF